MPILHLPSFLFTFETLQTAFNLFQWPISNLIVQGKSWKMCMKDQESVKHSNSVVYQQDTCSFSHHQNERSAAFTFFRDKLTKQLLLCLLLKVNILNSQLRIKATFQQLSKFSFYHPLLSHPWWSPSSWTLAQVMRRWKERTFLLSLHASLTLLVVLLEKFRVIG